MITFTENRTLIAKIDLPNSQRMPPFDLNSFLMLFVEEGHFSLISKQIVGIIPVNLQEKTYSVSFTPNNETIIKDLLLNYAIGKEIDSPTHETVLISFSKPKPPPKTVTLWPVSHEVTPQILNQLVEDNGWGKLERFAFGRHKSFPQFHNAYLHLQISQYNPNAVPDHITINNNTVMVLKPGETNMPRCNFCKNKGHTVSTCPRKNKSRVPRTTGHVRSDLSYSAAAKSFDTEYPLLEQPPQNNLVVTNKNQKSRSTDQPPTYQERGNTSQSLQIIESSLPLQNDKNEACEDHKNQNTIQSSVDQKSESLPEEQPKVKSSPLESEPEETQDKTSTLQPHTPSHPHSALTQQTSDTLIQPPPAASDTNSTPDLSQLFMKHPESRLTPTSSLFSDSSSDDDDNKTHIDKAPSHKEAQNFTGRNGTPSLYQRGSKEGFRTVSAKKKKRKQSNNSPSGSTPPLKVGHMNKSSSRKKPSTTPLY